MKANYPIVLVVPPLSIASSLCWVKTKAPAFDYKAGALFLALTWRRRYAKQRLKTVFETFP